MSYYVYTLSHPNGMVFYVGKGTGTRAEHHLAEARSKTCRCDKCRIIHKIWKDRLEVKIDRVFETENHEEARQHERDLISQLRRRYPLCNKQLNPLRMELRSPEDAQHMTLVEYKEHLSYYDLTKREYRELIKEYGWVRVTVLEQRVDQSVRRKNFDEVRRLIDEIEVTGEVTGCARQRRLSLG